MSRRCVVTGGAGVIGQTLVERLIARGDRVRVIDVLPPPPSMSPDVDYVQGDLVDVGTAAIGSFDPHVLFHLAATFERSEEEPDFWRENAHHNVAASAATLAGAERSPSLDRYVFASSYLIYDPNLYLFPEPQLAPCQLSELSAIHPRNACGAAKLLHEMEIELVTSAVDSSFSAVSARIYRVYGRGSRDVISRWVRAAVRGDSISVYGSESTFDYVFADDVAEGLARLGDSDAIGVVNLASGRSRSVNEVLACLETHFPDLDSGVHTPATIYEASEADVTRLRDAIGWSPLTELEHGISRLVEHERENVRADIHSVRVREPIRASVLISSLGSKAHIVRAVRLAQHTMNIDGPVWGGDADAMAPARILTDHFWTMPPIVDLEPTVLVRFCRDNEIRLIVPTRDGELLYFAEHQSHLAAEGIFVPVGDVDSIRDTGDKLAFAQRLSSAGLRAIPTARSVEDLDWTTERYVVKPQSGAGGKGLHLGVSENDARKLLDENHFSVVQPFVAGDEYSVDLYIAQDGGALGALCRRRVRVVNGEAQITTVTERPDIAQLATDAALAVGVRGHAVIQVIDGADGPTVIECNSRVGGASSAAWASGLRSIDAMLLEALGEPVGPMRPSNAPLTETRLSQDHMSWA